MDMERSASKIIFGGSSLGGLYEKISRDDVFAAVQCAISNGITEFDTAPHYGTGSAETMLGQALRSIIDPPEIKIITKVGRRIIDAASSSSQLQLEIEHSNIPGSKVCIFHPGATQDVLPVLDYSKSGFMKSYHESLHRLQVDRIYGLRVHDCDTSCRLASLKGGDGIPYLTSLRTSGEIQHLSIGCNDISFALEQMKHMPVLDSVLIAGVWNLLDHPPAIHALFNECHARNIEIHIAGVYASGILASSSLTTPSSVYYKYSSNPSKCILERVLRWEVLATRYGVPLAAVALQFAMLPRLHKHRVVIGYRSEKEVAESLVWLKCNISKGLWKEAAEEGLLEMHALSLLDIA